jgi:outer membrane murein-binding lipoprotein Lpp
MAFTRLILTVLLAVVLALPLVSCDKLGQMMGKKDEKAEQVQQTEQKLKEMEAKMLQMEAEAKARKEAEDKAKAEEELRAKIAAEVKAQAETQPASPTTQPTTPPAATTTPPAPAPTKVVERVIVKEVPVPAPATPAPTKASGYVRLYDDAGFTDRILTVRFGRDIGNMHYVNSDDGKAGFNDKASSVKYSVPAGWHAILYENNNYSKRGYSLKGAGSIPDMGYFGDKCSSIRWERAAE